MGEDFCLHKSNLNLLTNKLTELTNTGKRWRIKTTEWRDLRTIPMNRTWRMWMNTTGDWLRARGVVIDIKNGAGEVVLSKPITDEETHEYFVGHWLGRDENGEREKTRKMDKEPMLYMMEKHEQ
ncbi:hypothetical protein M5U04_16775 [Xenorhabdus sp. XENO-1]|uniref:hypothetical protein n=1 Tax=Xenorhabdus bovienii TaxID=40576 RepID=UPI0020CA84FD|nr:hypothetical protein [Xenorhabdus bovienii]MCP9269690.1 hypothetical protein [Xenorhabdus bovienii subsp. africana]